MRRHTWMGLAAAIAVLASGVIARADDRVVRELNFYDLDPTFRMAVSGNGGPKPPELADVDVRGLSGTEVSVNVAAAPSPSPRVLNVLSIDDPPFTADDYAVTGVVGYAGDGAADMDGVGYLELWSEFPGGGRFFTRTLADAGPLRKLAGHSADRPFRLPFHSNPGQRPTRISLNLVLPGRALVTLGELKLVQDEPATRPSAYGQVLEILRAEEARRNAEVSDLTNRGYMPASEKLRSAKQALDAIRDRISELQKTEPIPADAAAMPTSSPNARLDRLREEEDRLAIKLSTLGSQLSPASKQLIGLRAELDAVRERIREIDGSDAAPIVGIAPAWWAHPKVTAVAVGSFGLVGFLGFAGVLMRRGRGRGLVLAAVIGVGLLGQVYFGWAMAVAGRGLPPRDWLPLLLCAIAGWCVPASIPIVNRRYRDAELRRMRALDAVAA